MANQTKQKQKQKQNTNTELNVNTEDSFINSTSVERYGSEETKVPAFGGEFDIVN